MSSRRRVRLASCRAPSESCSGRFWVSTSREKNSSASASIPRIARPILGTSRTRPTNRSLTTRRPTQADAGTEQDDERADRGIPFRRRHRLYGPIALYGGRVEPDNGCEEMLEYFDTLRCERRRHVTRADGREDDEGARRAVRAAGRRSSRPRTHGRVRSRGRDDRSRPRTICWRSRSSKASPWARRSSPARGTLRPWNTAAAAARGLYYANRDEFVEALRALMTRSPSCANSWARTDASTSASITGGTRCSAVSSVSSPWYAGRG